MRDSKTLRQLVDNDPEAMLRHLVRIQMYAETLKSVVQQWAEQNGEYVSANKTVKYQRRTREYVKLDPEKAGPMLEEQGFDLMDIADIRLTQEAIIAKLGQVAGNKVISELVQAGAVKVQKTTYWRLQVK